MIAAQNDWPLPVWGEKAETDANFEAQTQFLIEALVLFIRRAPRRLLDGLLGFSAGWFLREFVDGFPWAHLDIAGTAYSDRDDVTRVKGPTGMGVRLFSEFVLSRNVSGERDPSLRSG